MPIQLLALIVPLFFSIGFYTHYKFSEADKVAETSKLLEDKSKLQKENDKLSVLHAKEKVKVITKYETVQKQIYDTVPQDTSCTISIDTLKLLNSHMHSSTPSS